jgi:hypothetical protein
MSYTPNKIPLQKRIRKAIFAGGLIAYGGHGVYVNDLYFPGKYGRGIHLHDGPALMFFSAMLCGALIGISTIVDHYDERNNEHKYKEFTKFTLFLGLWLFIGSGVWRMAGIYT